MGYDWNFRLFVPFIPALVRGTLVTILLAVISSVVGTFLGFLVGAVLRLPIVGPPLRIFNDMARAVPLLVLIFSFYYFPYLQLAHVPAPGPFLTAALALTVAQINFTAEVVRGAIDGVSARLIDAGRSIGLKNWMIWRFLILPDVFRQILPTLVAFFIGNIKLSSLASVIGCEELVFNARLAVGMTFHSLEAWVVVAGIYIVLVLPLTIGARILESSEWLLRRS